MRWLLLALALAGCAKPSAVKDGTAGGRLEAAAVARGLVADPATAGLVGLWSSDTDRICVAPSGGGLRLGASVDYGEGQACAASGTVEQRGDRLRVGFGACRFDARFDGDRIAFPAELPAECQHYCAGRATLAAVAVTRLSESQAEAVSLRGPNGQRLCGS